MFPNITPLLVALSIAVIGAVAIGYFFGSTALFICLGVAGFLFVAAILYIASNTRFT